MLQVSITASLCSGATWCLQQIDVSDSLQRCLAAYAYFVLALLHDIKEVVLALHCQAL